MKKVKRFLSTPGCDAYFDFLSNIIVLERYDKNYLQDFQRAIVWEPGEPLDARATDIRALLKHEVTHFLDTTTTAWGAQYTVRKLRMLCGIQGGGDEFNAASKVFAIESGELEMHSALVQASEMPPASCDTIQHELIYREEFGVCLIIHYVRDGRHCHKVPVSMLSLLEANATASEFLSLLQCAESQDDHVERLLAKELVERRFDIILNDHELLEYSVLLHLTRVHFKELSLFDLLKFVAALARFSLDASSIETAALANPIQRSFRNSILGDSLGMELRRDSCRQIIYFKSVLFMYDWMRQMDEDARVELLVLMRKAPIDAIRRMWKEVFGIDNLGDFRNSQASIYQTLIRKFGILDGGKIFSESSNGNRKLLEATSVGLLSFNQMKLLNALLSDEAEVVFPNGIEIVVADYFNHNLKTFSRMDAEYRNMKHERCHIRPDSLK